MMECSDDVPGMDLYNRGAGREQKEKKEAGSEISQASLQEDPLPWPQRPGWAAQTEY